MVIIGAGMAGCLAGILTGKTTIIERETEETMRKHKAVLRFRTDNISKITGIPFKRITVRKGIWFNHQYHQPEIRFLNMYSCKVAGKIIDRSISNIEPASRYLAPENFHEQMLDMLSGNIAWGEEDFHVNPNTISTIPMFALDKLVNGENAFFADDVFQHSKISVMRIPLHGCDVYQTIYYPHSSMGIYRASISKDVLIIETVHGGIPPDELVEVVESFGLDASQIDYDNREFTCQGLGKIVPIDEKKRKKFILDMTMKHKIYSLGRFATWRNILMDDVFDDIMQIKELMHREPYDTFKYGGGSNGS